MELLNSKLSNSAGNYPSDQVSRKVLSNVLAHKCSFDGLVCSVVISAGLMSDNEIRDNRYWHQ